MQQRPRGPSRSWAGVGGWGRAEVQLEAHTGAFPRDRVPLALTQDPLAVTD